MQLSSDGSTIHIMGDAASVKAEQLRASQLVLPTVPDVVAASPSSAQLPAAKARRTLQTAVAKAANWRRRTAITVPDNVLHIFAGARRGAAPKRSPRRS